MRLNWLSHKINLKRRAEAPHCLANKNQRQNKGESLFDLTRYSHLFYERTMRYQDKVSFYQTIAVELL